LTENRITHYTLDDKAATTIRNKISAHDGGEIFFGCHLNENGQITAVDPVCYGNDEAVLAPYELVGNYNAILHNHPSGNTKPSSQDLSYAGFLQKEGIGFFITNNEATRLTTVMPPVVSRQNRKIDEEDIEDLLGSEGKLASMMTDYEHREGQVSMARMISRAFNTNKTAVIEAGTGIGKSLAYLIPAFLWADTNSERIVISTNTINLQNQLMNKDIPLVKKITGSTSEAILVKGRRNYLCKLKLSQAQLELNFDDEADNLESIIKWSTRTKNGDLDELSFIPTPSLRDLVTSDADFCTGSQCSYYTGCFLQAARRRASESNILVINHHILFADISIRSASNNLDENMLLPPYRRIVIDEGHNIERSASTFFSLDFSKRGFYYFMRTFKGKRKKGVLARLQHKLARRRERNAHELSEYITDTMLGAHATAMNGSQELFDEIGRYLDEHCPPENEYETKRRYHRILLDEWKSNQFQDRVVKSLKSLVSILEDFERTFELLVSGLESATGKMKEDLDLDFRLVSAYHNKLKSYITGILQLISCDIYTYVLFFDIFGSNDDSLFTMTATPLYINEILKDSLFDLFDSVAIVSATLTVNRTFDYFNTMTGIALLDQTEIITDLIESPFDYRNQVLFITPTDIPEPRHPDYSEKLNNFIEQTVKLTRGSAFVLFTSYRQLEQSYEEINPLLEDDGLRAFYQGQMEKSKLLDKFIAETDSTLFATDSFWEGVDAPGKTLRYVILAKLPFRMPSTPVEQARVEQIEKEGRNPFTEYTLPGAIIRFRQGFGRLIRKHDDYGVVALLDTRATSKWYGKQFFHSIPRCGFAAGTLEQVEDAIISHMERCSQRD
jgi:ATP-dependent DNA helicase DinG